jgi:PII-like signaling protein
MPTTVTRTRIEVLVDAPLVRRLVAAADEVGVSGWTVLPTVMGRGASGAWSDDELSGASAKQLFMTVTSADKADRLVTALAPLLDAYGLVLIVGEVQVVRGERF